MHVPMDQLEQLKQEYQLSTAYHEAAHEVLCIAQKIPIREFGLRIDPQGRGVAHTFRRNSGDPNNTADDVREREESIVLLFAGEIGQVRIFPETPFDAIAKDQSQIDVLLDEMHRHKSTDWYAAKDRLRKESERLVAEHWQAIDAQAKALWSKPWKPQEQLLSMDAAWSSDKMEKSMDAKEVEAVVKEFGLRPMIRPDEAGSYVRPFTKA
jgi:hypothetical protein